MLSLKSLLQWVQLLPRRQALHCVNVHAIDLRGKQQAATHCLAVQEYGAGPTDAVLTSQVGTGKIQLLTQKIRQALPRLGRPLDFVVIDP
jgi:hypothetical protein